AILLPTVMVYKVRYTDFTINTQDTAAAYQVLGGSKALFLAGSIGVFIIAIQILISVGLLPSLG
ncbi:MAG: tyrosine transporter TyrP, partial [Photobacterium aquimaris]|nr:tyrosine transporter TyrP [Photobacterium aquimaris]